MKHSPRLKRQKATKHQYKNTAMAPLTWFASIAEGILMSGLIFTNTTWLQIGLFVIVVFILLLYGGVYVYFMLKDPDRLQSEGYNLEAHELTLLSGNDTRPTIDIDASKDAVTTPRR